MGIVVGVLVVGLIAASSFGSYMWAESRGSRRLVEWNERTNPSTAVLEAITATQTTTAELVSTITSTLSQSVKSMLGMDTPTDVKPEYEEEVVEAVAKPFAEWDPYMNDDLNIDAETIRSDYAL